MEVGTGDRSEDGKYDAISVASTHTDHKTGYTTTTIHNFDLGTHVVSAVSPADALRETGVTLSSYRRSVEDDSQGTVYGKRAPISINFYDDDRVAAAIKDPTGRSATVKDPKKGAELLTRAAQGEEWGI